MTGDTLLSPKEDEQRLWSDAPWQSDILRPLLIAILATCFVAGPIALVVAAVPQSDAGPILPLCFVTALVAVYSTQWMSKPSQRLLNKLAFRLAQFVLLAAALRLATWIIRDQLPNLAMARAWLLNPLSFFDLYFIITVILAVVVWDRSASITAIFQQLALEPGELAWFQEQRKAYGERRFPMEVVRLSRQDLYEQYVNQWVVGGALLVLCAGLSQTRLDRGAGFNILNLGIPPQLIVVIIAYFLIGLVLTSQARLAVLRAQWLYEGSEQAPEVPGRWQRLSLVLVLGIGLLATLLPLGSTWQIGQVLSIILLVISQVIYAVIFGLFLAFASLLSFLGLVPPPSDELALPMEVEPPPAVPPVAGGGLPAWLTGAGFWLVIAVVVVYAAIYALGRQGIALNRQGLRRFWQRLIMRLRSWWFGLRHTVASIQIGRPRPRDKEGQEVVGTPPWRFLRLGGLPPREKVRYFYVSTVRRAGERGVARKPSQTPLEFAHDLEAAWPEAEMDVEALTGAFVSARYDSVEISPPQAKEAQGIWERVKRALRRRRQADQSFTTNSEVQAKDEP